MREDIPLKPDLYYSEALSHPSYVSGIAVGHFTSRTAPEVICLRSTNISLYTYTSETKRYTIKYQFNTWKEATSIATAPQSLTTDCLFLMSVHGDWLLLQWHKTQFFPLASGSLTKSLRPLIPKSDQNRFYFAPSFCRTVHVVPISPDSPVWLQSPPVHEYGSVHHQKAKANSPDGPFESSVFPTQHIPLVTFRAVIVVDETIFVGVSYDGPPAYVLEEFTQYPSTAMSMIPTISGHSYVIDIQNGMEDIWKIQRPFEQNSGEGHCIDEPIDLRTNKKILLSCFAKTFVFFEKDFDSTQSGIQRNDISQEFPIPHIYSLINRVRDFSFAATLVTPPFPKYPKSASLSPVPPIPGQDYLRKSYDLPTFNLCGTENQNCTVGLVLCDTPAAVALLCPVFDFTHQTVMLLPHSFVALSPSSSRLLIDEQQLFTKHLKNATLRQMVHVDCQNAHVHKAVLSSSVSPYPSSSDLFSLVQNVSSLIENNIRLKLPSIVLSSFLGQQHHPSKAAPLSFTLFPHPIGIFSLDRITVILPTLQSLSFTFQFPLSDLPLFALFHTPSAHNQLSSQNLSQRKQRPNSVKDILTPPHRIHLSVDPVLAHLSRQSLHPNQIQPPSFQPIHQLLLIPSRIGPQILYNLTTHTFTLPVDTHNHRVPAHAISCCTPERIERPFMVATKQDAVAKGVGTGKSGALYISNIGHKAIPLIQTYRFDRTPTFFVTGLTSGSDNDQLLLVSVKDSRHTNDLASEPTFQNETVTGSPFRTLLYQLSATSCDPLDAAAFGVAGDEHTILFAAIEGALVQITTSKMILIPTQKYVANPSASDASSPTPSPPPFVIQQIAPSYTHAATWVPPVARPISTILNALPDMENFKDITFPPRFAHLISSATFVGKSAVNNRFQVLIRCACASRDLIALSTANVVFVFLWRMALPKSQDGKPANPTRVLSLIQTLSFLSDVSMLKADTIHNSTFLIVGTTPEGKAHLFRLDTLSDSIAIENHIAAKRKEYLNMPLAQKVQQTQNGTDPLLVHSGHEEFSGPYSFIELQNGSEEFIQNQVPKNWRMTHFFSINLRNEPSSAILTTLHHSVRTCDRREADKREVRQAANMVDAKDDMSGSETGESMTTAATTTTESVTGTSESTHSSQMRKEDEEESAALLMIGVRQGSVSWVVLPLTFILHRHIHSIAPLSPNTPETCNILVPPFQLLPRVFSCFVGDLPVHVEGDKDRVLVYSDTIAYWSWNVQSQAMVCIPIFHTSPFHRVLPVRLTASKDKEATKSTQFPTHLWVDLTNPVLVFGTIDPDHSIVTRSRIFTSSPIKITYIPHYHAIAVLAREPLGFQCLDEGDPLNIFGELQKKAGSSEADQPMNLAISNIRPRNVNTRLTWLGQQNRMMAAAEQVSVEAEVNKRLPFRDIVLDYIRREMDPSIVKFVDFPNHSKHLPQRTKSEPSLPTASKTEPRLKLRDKIGKLPFLRPIDPPADLPLPRFPKDAKAASFLHWTLIQHSTGFHPRTPKLDLYGVPFADLATEFYKRRNSIHEPSPRPILSRPTFRPPPLGYSSQSTFTVKNLTNLDMKSKVKYVPFVSMGQYPPHDTRNELLRAWDSHNQNPLKHLSKTPVPLSDAPENATSPIPLIFIEDGSDPLSSLPDLNIYTYNLLIFDDHDLRNQLCRVLLSTLTYSIASPTASTSTNTENADGTQPRSEWDEWDTHHLKPTIPTELTLESHTFHDMACVTIPTSAALSEMRTIEEKLVTHQNLRQHVRTHSPHNDAFSTFNEEFNDMDLDSLDVTPMGAGLTPDEASRKYTRTFIVVAGREWKPNFSSQLDVTDLFVFEISRMTLTDFSERFGGLHLSALPTDQVLSPSNSVMVTFSNLEVFQNQDTAACHNPDTHNYTNLPAWPISRLRVWGNVQTLVSEGSFLVVVSGPNVLIFNFSQSFSTPVLFEVDKVIGSLGQSGKDFEMTNSLPDSFHCSCCQPFFDEHSQPRRVFPVHYSSVSIHSYSSSWVGLSSWKHSTRQSRNIHPVLTHLVATLEAPAFVTSFAMSPLLSPALPNLQRKSLSYCLDDGPSTTPLYNSTDTQRQASLSHLVHWSVYTPRTFRMALVAAPCSVYVCDMILPHGFPTSLQLTPCFTQFCLLHSNITQSSIPHDIMDGRSFTKEEDADSSSTNDSLRVTRLMHNTYSEHIPSDPLPLSKASPVSISQFLPTHSALPDLTPKRPSSELIKIGTAPGFTVKNLALSYLPSIVQAVNLITATTVGILCDRSTILMLLYNTPREDEEDVVIPRHCARCGSTFNCRYISFPAQLTTVARRELPEPQDFLFHVSHGNSFEAQNIQTKLYKHFFNLAARIDDIWSRVDTQQAPKIAEMDAIDKILRMNSIKSFRTSLSNMSKKTEFTAVILNHLHRTMPANLEMIVPHRIRMMPHFTFQQFPAFVPVLTIGMEGSSSILHPLHSDKIPMLDAFTTECIDVTRSLTFAYAWHFPTLLQSEFDQAELEIFRNFTISAVPLKYLEGRHSEADDERTLRSFMKTARRYVPPPTFLSSGRVFSSDLLSQSERGLITGNALKLTFPTELNIIHATTLIHGMCVSREAFTFELWKRMRVRFKQIEATERGPTVRIRKQVVREFSYLFSHNLAPPILNFLAFPYLALLAVPHDTIPFTQQELEDENANSADGRGGDSESSSSDAKDDTANETEADDWASGKGPNILDGGEPLSFQVVQSGSEDGVSDSIT
ncbi:hypothetical protein BLNAU_6817 [Blattamonas nauphoetae]|uniref:Uncharacterized protein n=1 Tax=Blattamonas nauphoetae TaxID=2049346 RepID=A0ABQ9Y2Z5_9EUKA|nr:hypothetical protein BLNAU_6817 [Blattamonas nauphoetae]